MILREDNFTCLSMISGINKIKGEETEYFYYFQIVLKKFIT